jgi:hypothetical protein
MKTVTLILPKDMTAINEKYSQILADVIAETLTQEELGYLIFMLEKNTEEAEL